MCLCGESDGECASVGIVMVSVPVGRVMVSVPLWGE